MSTDHSTDPDARTSLDGLLPPISSHWQHQTSTSRYFLVIVLCCLTLLAIACGPERAGPDNEQLIADTQRIAQEYEVGRNLALAQTQLAALDVANPQQWLLFVAEEGVAGRAAPDVVNALVRLSIDLGLQAASIMQYAENNGLIERAAASAAASVAQAVVGAEAAVQRAPSDTAQAVAPAQADAAAADSQAQTESSATESSATGLDVVAQDAADEPTPIPTDTPLASPALQAETLINVRGGPGLTYPIVAGLDPGTKSDVVGKNSASDWWQIALPNGQLGWVYAPLVTTSGNVSAVAVAANIPAPPPPTATPVPPAVEAQPTPAPVEAVPVEPAPTPVPSGGPDFRLVEHRLRSVEENGGRFDGPSVICGEKHELVVEVIDAGGAILNGVAVEGIYTKEVNVTGSQGKGEGKVEYVLWSGEDVKIVRDVDGRAVTSDVAAGNTTRPAGISHAQLIQAGYCRDGADCQRFIDLPGCYGHHSWFAKFQRNY